MGIIYDIKARSGAAGPHLHRQPVANPGMTLGPKLTDVHTGVQLVSVRPSGAGG